MLFCKGKDSLRRALRHSGPAMLFVVLLMCSGVSWCADDQGTVKFRWAFGALKQSGSDLKLETVGSRSVLKSGDQLKMMVNLESECFVYVIHHSSQDTLKLMFPYSLRQISDDSQQHRKYFIPEGDRWFQLDQQVGPETFYLLASTRRLENLERLFQQYESAEPSRRAQINGQVLDEIGSLKKQHRDLVATAERPETIGGVVRGFEKAQGMNPPDISVIAREISGPGFVSRTFTIDHQ
jgi:hypothetical protein